MGVCACECVRVCEGEGVRVCAPEPGVVVESRPIRFPAVDSVKEHIPLLSHQETATVPTVHVFPNACSSAISCPPLV